MPNMTIRYSSLEKHAGVFLFLLFSASIMIAGNAHAGNERWKAIAGKTGEDRMLYDPDSIIPSGPRTFRVWSMGFDADHSPRKSQEEFDCTNKIVRDVEVITERPNKPATHTFTPSEWRGIEGESSPRRELYKILCR
jgi:hypothetical protein